MGILEGLHATVGGETIYIFLISMLPVIELRGAIPVGIAALGRNWAVLVYVVAVLGNMVPVPFILVYIRRIFHFLRDKNQWANRIITKLEKKAHLKGNMVSKYRYLGLLILVAIPLPGTGAWTGALVAALMDMRLRVAVPVILAGVMIAGMIMTLLSVGVVSFF